ncbi:hypothetical protein AA0Y32_02200 [Georgenia phoenicis]|uniref:hypothetical protein n=1 Tax=unclassified Georgenia TaxID=2626815 RepID=UPI0039B11BC0
MREARKGEDCTGCEGTTYMDGMIGHPPDCTVVQTWLDVGPNTCACCAGALWEEYTVAETTRRRRAAPAPVPSLAEAREAARCDTEVFAQHRELLAFKRELTTGEALIKYLHTGHVKTHIRLRWARSWRWTGPATKRPVEAVRTEALC